MTPAEREAALKSARIDVLEALLAIVKDPKVNAGDKIAAAGLFLANR